jgi:transcriptional regulator with PAS, ATPase and Fis domain
MTTTLYNSTGSSSLAQTLEKRVRCAPGFERIVGASESMREVLDQTQRVAATESTVLITGESGTGKELIAEAIRNTSRRRNGPFVTINMAAVPDTLVESELFGHVKGSFTGAASERTGRIEAADRGTLFIDEIGDLALPSQAKLLRVLEDYKVSPVGGNEDTSVDVRLVAATSRNLERMVCEGSFREDLYYRLNVVNIHIPPLRQRRGDVLILAKHFLQELCAAHNKPETTMDDELMRFLTEHDWPGNVRQLRNCIESMVVLARANTLTKADLPPTAWSNIGAARGKPVLPRDRTLADIEKLAVMQRLDQHDGNRTHTAASLGISLRTLQRKLKAWDSPAADATS